jgi:hypothetical protein
MQAMPFDAGRAERYELRFRALSDTAQTCSFPCDAHGHVDLDALNERARNAYFFARVVVGHDYAPPQVQPVRGSLVNLDTPDRAARVALTA